MTTKRTLLAWSTGKDSAFALHLLRASGEYDVVGLLTTINEVFDRVAMHAVARELLELQAAAVGLPLWPVMIPWPCSNEQYEAAMRAVNARAVADGITHVAFGDLFLRDIRAYRERTLVGTGLTPVFPVWREDTGALAAEMLGAGIRATLACVDPRALDAGFAGREYDAALLEDLPPGVDRCGENGEFHTFAWDGPGFAAPVPVHVAGTVERDGFVFADIRPARGRPGAAGIIEQARR